MRLCTFTTGLERETSKFSAKDLSHGMQRPAQRHSFAGPCPLSLPLASQQVRQKQIPQLLLHLRMVRMDHSPAKMIRRRSTALRLHRKGNSCRRPTQLQWKHRTQGRHRRMWLNKTALSHRHSTRGAPVWSLVIQSVPMPACKLYDFLTAVDLMMCLLWQSCCLSADHCLLCCASTPAARLEWTQRPVTSQTLLMAMCTSSLALAAPSPLKELSDQVSHPHLAPTRLPLQKSHLAAQRVAPHGGGLHTCGFCMTYIAHGKHVPRAPACMLKCLRERDIEWA
jgi:hypothetical protein